MKIRSHGDADGTECRLCRKLVCSIVLIHYTNILVCNLLFFCSFLSLLPFTVGKQRALLSREA